MLIIVSPNVSLFWFTTSARLALTLEVAFLSWGGLISGHALRKSLVQFGGQRTSLWWVPWRKGPPRRSFFLVSPSALRSIWKGIWSLRRPLELGDPRIVGRRSPQPENKILPSRLVQKSKTIFFLYIYYILFNYAQQGPYKTNNVRPAPRLRNKYSWRLVIK